MSESNSSGTQLKITNVPTSITASYLQALLSNFHLETIESSPSNDKQSQTFICTFGSASDAEALLKEYPNITIGSVSCPVIRTDSSDRPPDSTPVGLPDRFASIDDVLIRRDHLKRTIHAFRFPAVSNPDTITRYQKELDLLEAVLKDCVVRANAIPYEESDDEAPPKPSEEDSSLRRTSIVVKNVPVEYDEQSLDKLFSTYGTVVSVKMAARHPLDSTTGFIAYTTPEEAEAAIKATNGRVLNGRTLTVEFNRSPSALVHTKVFIQNLPLNVTETDLFNVLCSFGTVTKVSLARRQALLTALASFPTEEEARHCVTELNGKRPKDLFPRLAKDMSIPNLPLVVQLYYTAQERELFQQRPRLGAPLQRSSPPPQ